MSNRKNYKGRSPNVLHFIETCGNEVALKGLISPNLAAGARLPAKNQSKVLDNKTAWTYELRLISLEKFAEAKRDDTELFGEGKRPFLPLIEIEINRNFKEILHY